MARKLNNEDHENQELAANGGQEEAGEATRPASKAEKERKRELKKVRGQIKRAENIGRDPKPHRVSRLQELLEKEWLLAHPDQPQLAEIRAMQRIIELAQRYRHIDERAEELRPLLSAPPTDIDDAAMVNAMLRLPELAHLKLVLERPGKRGKEQGNKLAVAGFLWMALASDTVNAKRVFDGFKGNKRLHWALGRPGGGAETKELRRRMQEHLRRANPELAQHALVELVRQVAEERDDAGRLLHPGAMEIIAADGCLIEAPVAQRKPTSKERDQLDQRGMALVDYVAFTDKASFRQGLVPVEVDPGEIYTPEPKLVKQCCGWRWVTLHSLRLNMPIIGGLFPANIDETKAVKALLDKLYQLWPEVEIRTFVGDGLYDTHHFHDLMARNYGIRVCASRGRKPGKRWESIEILDKKRKERREVKLDWGVPQCDHGAMELYSIESDNCTLEKRRAAGLRPGEPMAEDTAAYRFRCRGERCRDVRLRASWNARLANRWPRVKASHLFDEKAEREIKKEDSELEFSIDAGAAERLVFSAMRNQVESLYAALNQDNVGGGKKSDHRPRWAADREMQWLLGTALLGRAARMIAWQRDLYKEADREYADIGVDQHPDEELQDEVTLDRVRRVLAAQPSLLPRPPRTWRGGLRHWGRVWREELLVNELGGAAA